MQKHSSDFPAAITGFLVGAVLVLALVLGIVGIVNSQHADKTHSGQGAH